MKTSESNPQFTPAQIKASVAAAFLTEELCIECRRRRAVNIHRCRECYGRLLDDYKDNAAND